MNKCVIKITTLSDLINLSPAYLRGDVKLNISKIAKNLDKDPKTVRRYLNGFQPKKTRNRSKYLDDYRDDIIKYLTDVDREFEYIDHLYRFMKREHSITCSRVTFNRYIRKDKELHKYFKENKDNSFTMRFETEPGEQIQFDLKEKVVLKDIQGQTYTTYIPTLTLSWSRYNYRRLTLQSTTQTLVPFLAKAFDEFGGVPREIVIDNLSPFVQKARKKRNDTPVLNSYFEQFCKDYNIEVFTCMPGRPKTKGKTETQNKITGELKNYNGAYTGILDMHEKLNIINNEDNTNISQATRLPRNFLFEKEKKTLQPLPRKEIRERYYLKTKEVIVSNESLVQYKYNKYSLPKEFIGKHVNLVIQNDNLYIYYNERIIERHKISNKKLNIKKEHSLYYNEDYSKENTIINNELAGIKYDND